MKNVMLRLGLATILAGILLGATASEKKLPYDDGDGVGGYCVVVEGFGRVEIKGTHNPYAVRLSQSDWITREMVTMHRGSVRSAVVGLGMANGKNLNPSANIALTYLGDSATEAECICECWDAIYENGKFIMCVDTECGDCIHCDCPSGMGRGNTSPTWLTPHRTIREPRQ